MATQLTRQRVRTALESDAPVLQLSARRMIAIAALVLVVAYASLLAAGSTARERTDDAAAREADASLLLEAPAPAISDLQDELAATRAELASAAEMLASPFEDPASDEVTSLLVTYAQSSAIRVSAITRIEGREQTVDETGYRVEAVRMNVAGTASQIGDFLHRLYGEEPGLIPTLTAMTAGANNVAEAEIVFSIYVELEATPTAGAGASGGAQ